MASVGEKHIRAMLSEFRKRVTDIRWDEMLAVRSQLPIWMAQIIYEEAHA
jgi:uncharacterized protein with HEPN domain